MPADASGLDAIAFRIGYLWLMREQLLHRPSVVSCIKIERCNSLLHPNHVDAIHLLQRLSFDAIDYIASILGSMLYNLLHHHFDSMQEVLLHHHFGSMQ